MSGGGPSAGGPGGSGRARTSSFAEPGGGGGGGGGGPGGSASGPGGTGGGKASVGAMGGGVGASSSGGGPSGSGGGGSGGPGAGTSFPPPGVKLGREYQQDPCGVVIGNPEPPRTPWSLFPLPRRESEVTVLATSGIHRCFVPPRERGTRGSHPLDATIGITTQRRPLTLTLQSPGLGSLS